MFIFSAVSSTCLANLVLMSLTSICPIFFTFLVNGKMFSFSSVVNRWISCFQYLSCKSYDVFR